MNDSEIVFENYEQAYVSHCLFFLFDFAWFILHQELNLLVGWGVR